MTNPDQGKATGSPAAEIVTPHYTVPNIVTCMRISARMLMLASDDVPNSRRHYEGQAKLLYAAADDLEAQFEEVSP